MENSIIVCIPGTWKNRTEFIESVIVSTRGDFMFAGMFFAHPKGNDHVTVDFCDPDEQVAKAFEFAGQGKLMGTTLEKIAQHESVVYLHFPFDINSQKDRILKFSDVLSKCGGIAAKIETSGIAHDWDRWFQLFRSHDPFDLYCACVVLLADEHSFYSCGMHNFCLPDAQIPKDIDIAEAADLMNRFNYWQIVEKPVLKSGETFSLTEDSPHMRLELLKDSRHGKDELFHNPDGLWELRYV